MQDNQSRETLLHSWYRWKNETSRNVGTQLSAEKSQLTAEFQKSFPTFRQLGEKQMQIEMFPMI